MPSRTTIRIAFFVALCASASAQAQSGLRLPERGEPGLDPALAGGWLAPNFDRFGFTSHHWREALRLVPAQRMDWSYAFNERGSLAMSMAGGRDPEYDPRQFSVFGRYWFASDWAVSAEANAREPTGLLRFNDLRFGVQRRF